MSIILISIIGFAGILGGTPAKAESVTAINEEISSLEEQLQQASAQLKKLTETVNETQTKIEQKNQEISTTKTEIESLQNEIAEIEKRIEARNVVLKERARSLQESGGTVSYLEVLLGAQSFSDFINRTEAVATIVTADKTILEEHARDMERVENAKLEVETRLQSLETMLTDLKAMEAETNQKMQELEDKEGKLQAEVSTLVEKKEALLAEEAAKAAAAAKAAEEAAKAASASQPAAQTSNSTAPATTTNSAPAPAASVKTSGGFGWPAVGGIITSYQGQRWGRLHKGIDIAGVSNRAILASQGGTVTFAGWHDSFGNYVKINHPNGYMTLYAHMSSLNVSAGQTVSKGQQIGVMGSTGHSTGMHLHFEVHQNGRLLNPMDVL